MATTLVASCCEEDIAWGLMSCASRWQVASWQNGALAACWRKWACLATRRHHIEQRAAAFICELESPTFGMHVVNVSLLRLFAYLSALHV